MDATDIKNEPRPSMTAIPIPKPALPKHIRDEATVTMVFPRKLSINLDNYMGRVDFDAGLQEVPVSLESHWYLVQQGVVKYEKPPAPPLPAEELTKQLEAAGYKVTPPEDEEDEVEEVPVAPIAEDTRATPARRTRKRG